MDKLRALYDRYPMMVVRIAGFILGVPAVCIIMLVIHEWLGFDVYQRLYAPVLAALASVYLFFLRKATAAHILTDHEGWDTGKSRFYNGYYRLLSILMVIFAMTIVWSLIEE